MPEPTDKKADLYEGMAEIAAKLGEESARVEISRCPPGGSQFYSVPGRSSKDFDPDEIARIHGGGEYKYVVRSPKGAFMGHYSRHYDPGMKPHEEPKVIAAPAPAAAPAFDMMAVVNLITAQNAQNIQVMQGMMTAMVQGATNRPAGPSMDELLSTVVKLKDLSGGAAPDALQQIKVMGDLFFRLKEKMGDGGDGGEPENRLLNKLIDMGAEILSKTMPVRQAAGILPSSPARPAPAPAAAAAAEPVKTPEVVAAAPAGAQAASAALPGPYPNVRQLLYKNGAGLLAAAKAQMPADAVALKISELFPEELVDEVAHFVYDAEAVDIIYRTVSPLEAYIPWLQEVVLNLRKLFTLEASAS